MILPRLFLVFGILLFIVITCNCQKNIQLVGNVSEINSKEPIVNAFVVQGANYTETNSHGIFIITLDSLPTTLIISRIGYIDTTIILNSLPGNLIQYNLTPSNVLNEVVVKDKSSVTYFERGTYLLEKVKNNPGVMGERDLQRTLLALPGINAGEEGDTKLNVRGGSDDQNLYLLDGSRIFNPAHIGGYLSTFNIDAVRDFQILKGNIPAEYGNFPSSVLHVTTKDGSHEKTNTSLKLGLVSSTFSIDGPLFNSKINYSISGRTSLLGLVTNMILKPKYKSEKTDDVITYNILDLNTKISYKINEKSNIYLVIYDGKDSYFYGERRYVASNAFTEIEADGNWQNKALTLGYINSFKKGFLKSTLSYSSYIIENLSNEATYENNKVLNDFNSSLKSSIQEIRNLNTYNFHLAKIKVKVGIENIVSINQPTKFVISSQPSLDSRIHLLTNAVFSEFVYSFSEKISTSLGGRVNLFNSNSYHDITLEPRFNLNYQVSTKSNISLSYSKMSQAYHKLLSSGLLAINDVWLLADKNNQVQKSGIVDMVISYKPSQHWKYFSAGVYYKNLNNLVHYQSITTADNLLTPDWQNNIYKNGTGYTYGLELSSMMVLGRLNLDLNYTYSRSFRLFDGLNNGKQFPFTYDRPHNLNISTQIELNSKWQFVSQFIYYSGRRVTLPVGYVFDNPILPSYNYFVFDEINNGRLPSFHRLDIAFNRTIKKKNSERQFSIGCYNLYNRKNATSFRINVIKDENPQDPDRPNKIKTVKNLSISF